MATLHLLGPVHLRDDAGNELVRLLRQPKRFAVLAYLAGGAPGAFHRRDRLMALFWPESTTEQARHGLRQVLYELRNQLGAAALESRGADEVAVSPARVDSDVAEFHRAVAAGDLDRVAEIYRGPFLDAFHLSGALHFMDWVEGRRVALRDAAAAALWELADRRWSAGDHQGAADAGRRGLSLTPTDEVATRRLIQLLADSANPAEALRVYDRLADRLARDFDLEPSPETRAVAEGVRRERHPRALSPQSRSDADAGAVPEPDVRAPPPAGAAPKTRARTPRGPWRVAAVFGVAGLASLGLVFGLARLLGAGPRATLMSLGVMAPQDRVVLADVRDLTDDPGLGVTLTELLRIDLAQSRAVQLAEVGTVRSVLRRMALDPSAALTQERALEVAQREGFGAVILADVASVGTGYVLTARILGASTGGRLEGARASARSEDDLVDAVDRLSSRLRARIGESLEDIRATPPLARVTTSSLPALRAYSMALTPAGLQEFQMAGVRLLRQAVRLDPDFAMAWRRLGIVLGRTGFPTDSRQAARRAYRLRDHLPPLERHLVTGTYFTVVAWDDPGAEAAYRSALDLDPENQTALINLGVIRSRGGQPHERERLAGHVYATRGGLVPYLNLLNALLLQGKVDQAEAQARALAQRLDEPLGVSMRFRLAVVRRDFAAARAIWEADPQELSWMDRSNFLRLQGRLAEAYDIVEERRSAQDPTTFGYTGALMTQARILADAGRGDEAVALLERHDFSALPVLERRDLERAELHAYVGQPNRARAFVEAFERDADPELRGHFGTVRSMARIDGELALAEGRTEDAVDAFRRANGLSGDCSTCGLARLAEAWRRAGREESARAAYERLVATPVTDLREDDARWLPAAYLELSRLYDAAGRAEEAGTVYATFADLRRDADPGLPPMATVARVGLATVPPDSIRR